MEPNTNKPKRKAIGQKNLALDSLCRLFSSVISISLFSVSKILTGFLSNAVDEEFYSGQHL